MIILFLHCFVFGVLLILNIRVVGEFDSEFFWFSVFYFFVGVWNFDGFAVCSS